MKRVELKIFGDVQGVSFRAWTKEIAESLELAGYVKNEPDGSVEIIAEGEESALKNLIEKCYNMSDARVERINVRWKEVKREFKGFNIKY